MNGKVVLTQQRGGHRTHVLMTGLKALGLVGLAWGVVYPSLLWSLKHLL